MHRHHDHSGCEEKSDKRFLERKHAPNLTSAVVQNQIPKRGATDHGAGRYRAAIQERPNEERVRASDDYDRQEPSLAMDKTETLAQRRRHSGFQ